MKRLAVFFAGLMIVVFAGAQVLAQDVVRMRFGHVAPPMHAQHKASEWFAQYVEKESGGRIKCSTHPQGQLAGDRQSQPQPFHGAVERPAHLMEGLEHLLQL